MSSVLSIVYRNSSELIPYVNNSRTHSDEQVTQVASSIKEFGFTNPILIDEDGGIIAGHGRLMAANKLGLEQVPTITLAGLTEAQKKAYVIADNKLALNSGWDLDVLRVEIEQLKDLDFNIDLLGFDDEELQDLAFDEIEDEDEGPQDSNDDREVVSLASRFGIAPFSVLNAREGWWQNRKRAWLGLGIKSELGRDAEMTFSPSSQSPEMYDRKTAYDKEVGRKLTFKEFFEQNPHIKPESTTSIFDPVMCELAYRWFSPIGAVVVDPFAGGSVRGVVASHTGRQYIGHELREDQVIANRLQSDEISIDPQPVWIAGDSRIIDKTCADVEADFIFSCPPYADLEVYSDDPNDLSTLSYPDFKEAYFEIISKTCSLLKEDSFACFVVGEVRDKKGNYYNFVGDTVEAFKAAGLNFYNEAILVTAGGSVAMRAGKQFSISRKLGKTHQNILVFVKGDGKKAASKCGVCDFLEIDTESEEI